MFCHCCGDTNNDNCSFCRGLSLGKFSNSRLFKTLKRTVCRILHVGAVKMDHCGAKMEYGLNLNINYLIYTCNVLFYQTNQPSNTDLQKHIITVRIWAAFTHSSGVLSLQFISVSLPVSLSIISAPLLSTASIERQHCVDLKPLA